MFLTFKQFTIMDKMVVTHKPNPLKMGKKMTNFKPNIHGFKFENDFVVEFGFAGINARFSGQCGGMVYAALDYFTGKVPIPEQNFRPSTGSVLQQYIYNRQLNSLGDNIDKWSELIINPFGWRTNEFFNWGLQLFNGGRLQELREAIDNKMPIPLGLIKAGNGGTGPHHQVLAIGYDMGRYKGDLGDFKEDLKIFIYDPNHSNEILTLQPHISNNSFYSYNEYPHENWQTYFVDKKYKLSMPPIVSKNVAAEDSKVNEVLIEIRTGGDDLRGGNDNANVKINFLDGTSQMINNINNGARWIDNYNQIISLYLDSPRLLNQIKSVTLQTTFRGGWNGDNWNVDKIRIIAKGENIEREVFNRSGYPLVRFNGNNTPFEARFDLN